MSSKRIPDVMIWDPLSQSFIEDHTIPPQELGRRHGREAMHQQILHEERIDWLDHHWPHCLEAIAQNRH